MERADLLYSGLMFAAGMLSIWALVLLTVTLIALLPLPSASLGKSAPAAATISSRNGDRVRTGSRSVAQESTSSRSLSETLPQQSVLGRPVRLI